MPVNMRYRTSIFSGFLLMPMMVAQFIFSDLGTFATPDIFSPEISSGHTIGQVFVSDFDGLTKIGVFFNKEDLSLGGRLVFHLRPSIESKADIVTVEVKISDLHDNWKEFRFPPKSDKKSCLYFFQFAPLRDSKGKSYYFYLEYLGGENGRGIRLGITNDRYAQGYSGGCSYIDGGKEDWYLLFQTYCAWTGSGADAFRQTVKRLSADKQFFTVYLLLCLVIVSALAALTILKHTIKKG